MYKFQRMWKTLLKDHQTYLNENDIEPVEYEKQEEREVKRILEHAQHSKDPILQHEIMGRITLDWLGEDENDSVGLPQPKVNVNVEAPVKKIGKRNERTSSFITRILLKGDLSKKLSKLAGRYWSYFLSYRCQKPDWNRVVPINISDRIFVGRKEKGELQIFARCMSCGAYAIRNLRLCDRGIFHCADCWFRRADKCLVYYDDLRQIPILIPIPLACEIIFPYMIQLENRKKKYKKKRQVTVKEGAHRAVRVSKEKISIIPDAAMIAFLQENRHVVEKIVLKDVITFDPNGDPNVNAPLTRVTVPRHRWVYERFGYFAYKPPCHIRQVLKDEWHKHRRNLRKKKIRT